MLIRMHFIYDGVSSGKLIDTWNEGFAKASGNKLSSIQKEADQFNSLFTDEAREGDVYDLSYSPGKGVDISMKGKLKDTIAGLDSKMALFSIWLGDKPADNSLKKGMLNK